MRPDVAVCAGGVQGHGWARREEGEVCGNRGGWRASDYGGDVMAVWIRRCVGKGRGTMWLSRE